MFPRYAAALLPLAVSACAQAVPLPFPDTVAPAAAASSVVAPPAAIQLVYTPRTVADPADWRGVNDGQGPGGDE